MVNQSHADEDTTTTPFEGPEKLLEIWFAPCAQDVECREGETYNTSGLRGIAVEVWEEMLEIVKCKILSTVHGKEIDAYLLSESSLFIWSHKLILKTCGRTLNLLGLPRILSIASEHAGFKDVYQLFYSRKSFMFPEYQMGPHRDWTAEVQFLDDIFRQSGGGSAYTIGKVNGDHWLLYLIGPGTEEDHEESDCEKRLPGLDCTIEILMSDLAPCAREPFFFAKQSEGDGGVLTANTCGDQLSRSTGIAALFPAEISSLDAYMFDPCGYSSNAIIKCKDNTSSTAIEEDAVNGTASVAAQQEGYYTIHVTPEEGYSYASFECNVALATSHGTPPSETVMPDLHTLVQRVVQIFQPGRLTLTVFMSCAHQAVESDEIEAAQRVFRSALAKVDFGDDVGEVKYRRTDKINYEFGNYDLAFATFERKRKVILQ